MEGDIDWRTIFFFPKRSATKINRRTQKGDVNNNILAENTARIQLGHK